MKKYLLQIEFRYVIIHSYTSQTKYKFEKNTIGIYDEFIEACTFGNKTLEILESYFKLKTKGTKKRFNGNEGVSGTNVELISQLNYLQTPFEFYVKIQTLNFDSVEKSIDNILKNINYNKG